MKLRDVDDIAWEGFLHMWRIIGEHASGEHARQLARWRAMPPRFA